MPFLTTRSFGEASGFSCCYRDHTDEESSLGYLHGSNLSFKIMFEADTIDAIKLVPQVMDDLEEFLDTNFGHTTVIAQDDPSMEAFDQLDHDGAIDLVVLQETGIEAFAKNVFEYCEHLIDKKNLGLLMHSVECREHNGISSIYARDDSVIELTEDEESSGT